MLAGGVWGFKGGASRERGEEERREGGEGVGGSQCFT